MSPDQRSGRQATQLTGCVECGDDLGGNTMRCPPCVEAAQIACREITDRPILPSDIAAIRARGE